MTVEVELESFIEDLWKMADDEYDFEEIQIMEDLVKMGFIGTSKGVTGVIDTFDGFQVIKEDDFDEEFPKYSKIMTWQEFCKNDCIYSRNNIAIRSEE